MSVFCWTQRKIFWRMWESEQFWGTIDFHSIFFSYYGSQWCPKTAWLQSFFKISSFVFGRTKTFIKVWNYLRVSKWWQNFHFWVNYPFKSHLFKLYTKKLCNFWTCCDQGKSTWNVKLPEAAFCSQIALAILQRIVLNHLTVILEQNNLAARSIWNEHRYRHL